MYHYIVKNKIVGFPTQINLLINRGFTPLTEEQTAFYLEHPTASVREVLNCQFDEPYSPPTVDVADYAAEKVKELKTICYGSVTVTSLEYAVAQACVNGTSLLYTGNRYYSVLQAKNVIKQFMDESNTALTVYNTYKPKIESARTTEAIDALMKQAKEDL